LVCELKRVAKSTGESHRSPPGLSDARQTQEEGGVTSRVEPSLAETLSVRKGKVQMDPVAPTQRISERKDNLSIDKNNWERDKTEEDRRLRTEGRKLGRDLGRPY